MRIAAEGVDAHAALPANADDKIRVPEGRTRRNRLPPSERSRSLVSGRALRMAASVSRGIGCLSGYAVPTYYGLWFYCVRLCMLSLWKRRVGFAGSVLFVCLGNICRSPTAEGVFRAAADRAGLGRRIHADSAGIGDWHIGSPPDPRAIKAAKRRGYDLSAIRGRRVKAADFARFGWILAMDESNLKALDAMKPAEYDGRLGLLLDF